MEKRSRNIWLVLTLFFALPSCVWDETSPSPTATPTPSATTTPTPTVAPSSNDRCYRAKSNGETFGFRLTNSTKISAAEAILSGNETAQVHVLGKVLEDLSPQPYNSSWHFHFDEDSIEFFEISIEACDALPSYVDAHLSTWAGQTWCPWGSLLEAEISCR